ncbi:double-CXXCG motif protein [Vitiosangium sp. GDMCC 1.1324]|uniref:SitI6 family double-CXXCG motif immunity protein n=1 Tax=Vitiosangium sp. (strain GDMCC 1.1324) TaxID=2138576 RepID=UPI000D3AF949|nr:double-CXXCG motif protein [Vitiosangium sp. GDMCC 1.1324]PTL80042.1 hypothetical protein DAT35_32030 [Vitiosangium sp. GDMCC 1.1324]
MRFYRLKDVKTPRYSGEYSAVRKWRLPGVTCPMCHATWGVDSDSWPCVDLAALPEAKELEEARLEPDYSKFERLRERVRLFAPEGALLRPGTPFGPLVGKAWGQFGELLMQNPWTLLMRREALERLRAEGLRGLQGGPTELRFRQKNAPELMELQLALHGRLHPDCLPPERQPPCVRCGRDAVRLPEVPILDAASLPADTDVFRLSDFTNVIVGSERFVETVHRLGYGEADFLELPLR